MALRCPYSCSSCIVSADRCAASGPSRWHQAHRSTTSPSRSDRSRCAAPNRWCRSRFTVFPHKKHRLIFLGCPTGVSPEHRQIRSETQQDSPQNGERHYGLRGLKEVSHMSTSRRSPAPARAPRIVSSFLYLFFDRTSRDTSGQQRTTADISGHERTKSKRLRVNPDPQPPAHIVSAPRPH